MKRILLLLVVAAGANFAQTTPPGSSAVFVVQGDRTATGRAVRAAGGELIEHPDLRADHVMARLTGPQRVAVERQTGAYIFEASAQLVNGERAPVCGWVEPKRNGPAAETSGEGWDGPGLGSALLTYTFGNMSTTWGFSPEQNKADVVRAMRTWEAVAAVQFTPGFDPAGSRNVHVLVANADHGDGFPFPPGVLAHAFYPLDFEPLSGDVHLSNAMNWGTYKLLATALHELGHALGLAHTGIPTAVMYPYYNGLVVPSAEDTAEIRKLYAAMNLAPPVEPAPPPPAPPPPAPPPPAPEPRGGRNGATALAITIATTYSTLDPTVAISGTASGGTAPYTIAWKTDKGYAGNAAGNPYKASLPLEVGLNIATVTVKDSTGATQSAVAQITRSPVEGGRNGR